MAPKVAKGKAKSKMARGKAKMPASKAPIPNPANVASLPPAVLARLPFQALYSKLQGQPAVMQIHSLVSQGTHNQPFSFLGPAAPPTPMALEEQRSKTQSTINEALQQMQGWRDRAELLQCLNFVVPTERFADEWPSIRDAAVRRCEAKTWPALSGDDVLVLLEFIGGGYGAVVAAAWVMRKDDWNAYKANVLAKPVESISNETLGGRTSDECFDSWFLMNSILESADPLRVNGFLAAFPDGGFGTADFFAVLDSLR